LPSVEPPWWARSVKSAGQLISVALQPVMVPARVLVYLVKYRCEFQVSVQGGVSHKPLAAGDESCYLILNSLDPFYLAVACQAPVLAPILPVWEQDIDQFAGDIESIVVAATKASTPQDNHSCSNRTTPSA